MIYKAIEWWSDAFHVFDAQGTRIGIVNKKTLRTKGKFVREIWKAHDVNFFGVKGQFNTRTEAAEAIPTGPIHRTVDEFS